MSKPKKMNKLLYLMSFLLLCSCSQSLNYDIAEVDKIELYRSNSSYPIKMQKGFEKGLIEDLKQVKTSDVAEIQSPYRLLIHHTSGAIDTLFTNGTIHQKEEFYESKENLLYKYAVDRSSVVSDETAKQLEVANQLRNHMRRKDYERAIELFSKTRQQEIRKLQQDATLFNYWCSAWTFGNAKYRLYRSKII